jgi:hypothetical protein
MELCPACFMPLPARTRAGFIFIARGSHVACPYLLCDACLARLESSPEGKEAVFERVELAIGPMKGNA